MKINLAFFLYLAIVLTCMNTIAQERIFYTPSSKIIEEAYEKSKQKEYNAAIEKLKNVYEGDSLFLSTALPLMMQCYIVLEDYNSVIALGKKYWYFRKEVPSEYYLAYGTALDQLKEFDEAAKMYKVILKEFPMNYSLWYNYAISLQLSGKYQESYDILKKVVQINPLYPRVHKALAIYAIYEKQTTKALMALSMYLMLSAETTDNFPDLNFSNEVAGSKYWTEDDFAGSKGLSLDGNQDFIAIDQLVHNYIALDKKYKIPCKLPYPLVKQMHLICTQVGKIKLRDDDFWHKTYVSFYQKIMKEKMFEGFSYYISTNIRNEKFKSIVDKKVKVSSAFISWARQTITKNFDYPDLSFIESIGKVHVIRNNKIFAITSCGDFKIKGDDIPYDGNIKVFNLNGKLISEGKLDNEGNKTGPWKFYYYNGNLKEESNYIKNIGTDSMYFYNEDGFLQYKGNLIKGKLNGDVYFYEQGALKKIYPYTNDELKEGKVTEYNKVGTLKSTYYLRNSKLNGDFVTNYSSGETEIKGTFKEEKLEGPRVSYFRNGKVQYSENFVGDQRSGLYESYNLSGQLIEKGKYLNGKQIGYWESYYLNGNKETEMTFDESGKENGVMTEYTKDGWKTSELIFKNGEIIGFKFFNKQGDILSQGDKKGNEFKFTGYYKNGIISREGVYGKNKEMGLWKYYDVNGCLNKEIEFVNGVKKGTVKTYFPNGTVKVKYDVDKEGNISGYYENHYRNGNLNEQCYYKDGEQDGPYASYYSNSVISNTCFYQDGKLHGFDTYYSVMGLPTKSAFYKNGIKIFTIEYDTLGIAFDTVYVKPGKQEITERKCKDCQIFRKYELFNGNFHGQQTVYYPNGKVLETSVFYDDERNGKTYGYYESGQLFYEVSHSYGDATGEWKFFEKDGTINSSKFYFDNKLHGVNEIYEDRKITNKSTYFNDELDGDANYYIDGKLDHIRTYDEGTLVEISYMLHDKKIVREITRETADVEIFWNNGKLARKFTFKNGYLEGPYLKYYDNGQLASESNFVNNWEQGTKKEYYPNGTVKSISNYLNDDLNGKKITYYPNGKIKEECDYVLDNKHGYYSFFDEKGKLIVRYKYFENVIVEQW